MIDRIISRSGQSVTRVQKREIIDVKLKYQLFQI